MNSPILRHPVTRNVMDNVSLPTCCALDMEVERRVCALASSKNPLLWQAQGELSDAVAKAGMHFEGRAYPVSLRPLAITDQQSKDIAGVAEQFVELLDWAAELYCRDASVQRLFPAYRGLLPWITALPAARPIVRVCRLDGLIASDGSYKVIETNTEGPGGVIQNGMAGGVWANLVNPLTEDLPMNVRGQPFVQDPDCFIDELLSAHRATTGRDLRRAAIVNFRGRFINEVDWMIAGLKRRGIKAQLLDAAAIRRNSRGAIGPDGDAIELAYNKLDVRDTIDAPEIADYLTACAAGEITSVNPLIAQWILSDKAILAVLSDHRFGENFTSQQRSLIRKHVPWTRYVADETTTGPDGRQIDLLTYVARNRAELVLKPSNATRGENVLVGHVTADRHWNEHLRRAANVPYVVQQYIEPGELTAPHPLSLSVERMQYGIDAYVFGGRFAGFQARASLDPVMNVGKRGVLLPVAIVNKGVV
jgi:hypothetical protein